MVWGWHEVSGVGVGWATSGPWSEPRCPWRTIPGIDQRNQRIWAWWSATRPTTLPWYSGWVCRSTADDYEHWRRVAWSISENWYSWWLAPHPGSCRPTALDGTPCCLSPPNCTMSPPHGTGSWSSQNSSNWSTFVSSYADTINPNTVGRANWDRISSTPTTNCAESMMELSPRRVPIHSWSNWSTPTELWLGWSYPTPFRRPGCHWCPGRTGCPTNANL